MSAYDLITVGRTGMDLFSEQVGAPFEDIASFSASVGGSPSNVAIGTARLGLKSAVLTGVGEDKVADFVRRYLSKEGVSTEFVLTKAGRTGLAVVGVQPPASFPLTFYRENPADIHITVADALSLPLEPSLLFSGTALARGSCRDATLVAAERASGRTYLDLDLRPDQWSDPRAYGANVRTLLSHINTVIGTEEESYACLVENANTTASTAIQSLTEAQKKTLETHLSAYLSTPGAPTTWVLKRGAAGVSIFTGGEVLNVPGFTVEVVNTVGAGDAFASGLMYAQLQSWDWTRSARFANACGALVVSRHGCSSAMPSLQEVSSFLKAQDSQ